MYLLTLYIVKGFKEEMSVIVLAGTIGAGKTSLSKMIAKELGSDVFYESVENNDILPLFYEDQKNTLFYYKSIF